jgi:MFS family permease
VLEYLALLRRRPAYRRLWLAEFVSQTGDWFSIVAVSIVSARGAGDAGPLALATVLGAHLLPHAVLAPVSGVIADRFDRKKLLVASNLLEGVLTVAMVAAAVAASIPALQLLLLLRASISAVREPAAGAALPRLVDKAELGAANAFGAATWSLTFVIGMALGGVATELGPAIALGIDAATFFAAALLLAGLPSIVPERDAETGVARPHAVARFVGDLRNAIAEACHPVRRGAVFGKTPMAIAAGVAWMALNLTAHRAPFVGGAAATLGVLQATRGLGTGVGPLLLRRLERAGVSRDRLAHAGALAVGLGALGLTWTSSPIGALASVLSWGAGGGALWVVTMTEIQERSADNVRGRLLALDALGFTLGMSGSALLVAVALERGISLTRAAAAIVAAATLGWLLLRLRPAAR